MVWSQGERAWVPRMANKAVINLEDGWSDMEVGVVMLAVQLLALAGPA